MTFPPAPRRIIAAAAALAALLPLSPPGHAQVVTPPTTGKDAPLPVTAATSIALIERGAVLVEGQLPRGRMEARK